MALTKLYGWTVYVLGDGTSTSFDWDLRELMKQSGIYPASPAGIYVCRNTATGADIPASLSGTVVTINFASAPTAGSSTGVSVELQF